MSTEHMFQPGPIPKEVIEEIVGYFYGDDLKKAKRIVKEQQWILAKADEMLKEKR